MNEVNELRNEIEKIKERNKKVERDKAWETSWERKVAIITVTYVFVVIVMLLLRFENPFVSALIPAIGFLLSTLSLDLVKQRWLKKNNN